MRDALCPLGVPRAIGGRLPGGASLVGMDELHDLDGDHIPDVVIEYFLNACDDSDPAEKAAYRNPAIFKEFYDDGERWDISRDDLAQYAGTAWVRWGDQCLDRHAWRELFDLAGYREDNEPADRPVEPLTLWRGATPEHRANWSWTENRDAALVYASGIWVQNEVGLVWRAVVKPERLLANLEYSRYSEYIVDTDGLLIEPDGLWCHCPVDLDTLRGSDREIQVALDIHELVACPRR